MGEKKGRRENTKSLYGIGTKEGKTLYLGTGVFPVVV